MISVVKVRVLADFPSPLPIWSSIFLGVIEETVIAIYISSEGSSTSSPSKTYQPSFVDHNEQIGDEGSPDRDLDGTCALTIKVLQVRR